MEEHDNDNDNDNDGGVVTSKMVGVSEVYGEVKANLMRSPVTSLVGMPGIGKTTLAKKILHDPEVVERFDYRVWVRVGQNCHVNDIPHGIRAKMDPEGDDDATDQEYLKAKLKSERYLIVLDDVWDRYITWLLHPYHQHTSDNKIHHFLDHSESGSRILLTSRLQQVDKYKYQLNNDVITMRLLNKKESWDLLREKVFSQGSCPPQLEKAGKKISKNCEGLPLTIITVAEKLSEAEKTPQYWNEVATTKNHQLFTEAYEKISKVLLPSYTYLPPILQMCFLFLGAFRKKYKIPRPKIFNLWLADGFRELNVNNRSHDYANTLLDELVSNSLVVVYQTSTFNDSYTIKTCGLHSSLWHLSNKKAREIKFCLVLENPNDGLGDGIKGYRRLSFHNNVLLGMKDVYRSVEDNCATTALTLLCYGPYHQYQVPICFGLKLLRELDVISIRFYEFPIEVLELDHLRYLGLTANGMIPSFISRLSKLQFLIVDRHISIKSHKEGPSYLPAQIWDMKELEYLQVMGSDLPDPCGASLERLSTLSNVSDQSCTKDVFNAIPNLTDLRIRIELAPNDGGKPRNCFAHVSHLRRLESLKCVIVNPAVVPPVILFPSSLSINLKKPSLSGLYYPWKEISKIASLLPCLHVLKLKSYAFQGSEWEVKENGFNDLVSCVIEDTDMVDWKVRREAFDNLRSLRIRHCYKLKRIIGEFGMFLKKIELVDCNPSCVEEIKKATTRGAKQCQLDVHSSWLDRKRKK